MALDGGRAIGRLQLTGTACAGEAEVKKMAVAPEWQRRRVGRSLMAARARTSDPDGFRVVLVAESA